MKQEQILAELKTQLLKTLKENRLNELGEGEYLRAIMNADSKETPMNTIENAKKFLRKKFRDLPEDEVDYYSKYYAKKAGLNENTEILDSQPETEFNCDDQLGNFWFVKKAVKESTEDDMVCETDIFGLAEMISSGQLTKEDVTGIYKTESRARNTSKKGLKQRDNELKEDIKTGSSQIKQLEQSISDIKTNIQVKTQEGIDNPGRRDSVSADIQSLYSKLDKQEKLIERLKAALGTKDKEEKPKDDKE